MQIVNVITCGLPDRSVEVRFILRGDDPFVEDYLVWERFENYTHYRHAKAVHKSASEARSFVLNGEPLRVIKKGKKQ